MEHDHLRKRCAAAIYHISCLNNIIIHAKLTRKTWNIFNIEAAVIERKAYLITETDEITTWNTAAA